MTTQLEYVRHFKELEVYERQRELSREVFRLSKRFPTEDSHDYSLREEPPPYLINDALNGDTEHGLLITEH